MENANHASVVGALEEKLGLSFEDKALALAALTHKSYCNEHRDEAESHNERLEFLGDSVIGLVVTQRLMQRFPRASEGELSQMRAAIVNEGGLALVARAIGLGRMLLLGRGEEMTGGRDKASLLADALEAVVGAIYLSAGLPAAQVFIEREFADLFSRASAGRTGLDYKSELQEEAQDRLHLPPRYRVISERGPEHEKIFEVEVLLGQDTFGRASGRSKKDAEQAAAREALGRLRERRESK